MTVGAPTSTTDRYLEACRSFLYGVVFLEVTCQVKRVPFTDPFVIDSNMALSTLLCGTSRQSYWNDLDTDIWSKQQLRTALLLT